MPEHKMSSAGHSLKPDDFDPPIPRRGRFSWCGKYVASEDSFIYPYRIGSSMEQVGRRNLMDSELTLTFAITDAGETCFSCAGLQHNTPFCETVCLSCGRFCKCCNCRRFFNLSSLLWILLLLVGGSGMITYGTIYEKWWPFKKLFISVGIIMYLCVALFFSYFIFDRKELRKYMMYMLCPWLIICFGMLGGLIFALVTDIVGIYYFVIMLMPTLGLGGYTLGEVFLTMERQRIRPSLLHEQELRAPHHDDDTDDKNDDGWTSRIISLHDLQSPVGKKTVKIISPGLTPSTQFSNSTAGPAFPSKIASGNSQAVDSRNNGGSRGGGDSAIRIKPRTFRCSRVKKLSVWHTRRNKKCHYNSPAKGNVVHPIAVDAKTVEYPAAQAIPLELMLGSSTDSLEETDNSASRLLPTNSFFEAENKIPSSPPRPMVV